MVVQESDLKSFIDKQSDFFNACKESIHDDALDKNITVLILWNTGGNLNIADMKRKVMAVEEDPYYFKKHVLYFSTDELESLDKIIAQDSLSEFLQNNIASQNVFNKYKEDPLSHEWQSLLYRISIKIPFVDIDIGFSDGLTSLFENNQKELDSNKDKLLTDFDKLFFNIEDNDLSAEKLLDELLPLLEGDDNGN